LTDRGGPAARLLSSPRRRRRLRTGAVLFAVLAVAAFVGIKYANTGHEIPEVFTNDPVSRPPAAPKAEELDDADAESVRQVAELFIDTAVMRHRVDRSWAITTAHLRQGMSRAEWGSGNIPVTPYPAAAVRDVRYRLDWSGANDVFLKVAIVPKPGSHALGQAFDMGLSRRGAPAQHRWLVDYWVPAGVGVDVNGSSGSPFGSPRAAAPAVKEPNQLSAAWIFLPVGLLAVLVLGLPLAIFGRSWLRGRRALREYEQSR
jgi:hypothetical protein